MGFFAAILLWPLRKAAVVPALLFTSAAVGAAYGSFDLSRRLALAFVEVPERKREKDGTVAFALFTSLTFTGLVVAAREALFAPAPVPTPLLSVDSGPLLQRLSNAGRLMQHHTVHYPLRFRFMTAFVSGCVGGMAYPIAVNFFNSSELQRAREERRRVAEEALQADGAIKPPEQQ